MTKTALDHTPDDDAAALVVDLTSIAGVMGSSLETFLGGLHSHPRDLLRALLGGPSRIRDRVRELEPLLAPELRLPQVVLRKIHAAKDAGNRRILIVPAGAFDRQIAGESSDLFDEVVEGTSSASGISERLDGSAYDLIGGTPGTDPIWTNARIAMTVDPDYAGPARPDGNGEIRRLASDPPGAPRWAAYLRALRPHQWSKNMLVFVPALAAHDSAALGLALFAFISFSLIASAGYILNDILDLHADRAHPRKRNRPFASGAVPLSHGIFMIALLFALGITIAALLTTLGCLAVVITYFVMTFLYSTWLKRKPILDILTLAGLYTLRIIAGAAATGIILSPWMLGFSTFLFLALAAVKRQAELREVAERADSAVIGRGYIAEDLPVIRSIGISAANAAVLVLALYISSSDVQDLYSAPALLWLICPILLYWTLRMVMKAHRGDMTDDPIVFAARDWISRITVLLVAVFVLAAANL